MFLITLVTYCFYEQLSMYFKLFNRFVVIIYMSLVCDGSYAYTSNLIAYCRAKPCTTFEVYEFIWRMFVLAKGNFPDISDDLVNCYHLLLCVIDWVYMNCVMGRRTDLINNNFTG